jgi:hypothetical protein
MKISKVIRIPVENTREVVDIKKENLTKDYDPTSEECN